MNFTIFFTQGFNKGGQMNGRIHFVTNEHGDQTGVLLDMDYYYQLVSDTMSDPNILIGLSIGELEALAEGNLTLSKQARLDELIAKQKAGTISDEESEELDEHIAMFDQLTLLKTRAKYTLHKMSVATSKV